MVKLASIMRLLRDLPMHLRRLGINYLGYFITGVLIPKVAYCLLYAVPGDRLRYGIIVGRDENCGDPMLDQVPIRRLRRLAWVAAVLGGTFLLLLLGLLFDPQMAAIYLVALGTVGASGWFISRTFRIWDMGKRARALLEAAQATYSDGIFASWTTLPVQASTRQAVEAAREVNPDRELVMGRIDRYGRLCGLFGDLPGREPIGEADFLERPGSRLEVVLTEDHVLVREDFLGQKARFVRQWYSLALLCRKANVPTIHHADENRCRLYVDFIPGRTLSSILEDSGTEPDQRDEFWRKVERQLDSIHACGVVGVSVKGEDIIVDAADVPWFTDFEEARIFHSASGMAFAFLRDQDRVRFNRLYGRSLMTERSARSALAAQIAKVQESQNWYSTIDFGNGLIVGPIWITSHGPGRWEFLNKNIVTPLVAGKRVLDLGSNNGVIPMMMLRAGAREVLGVELSPLNVESAKLVHRVYEWHDMRDYRLTMYTGDMLEAIQKNWGKFDVVTAFCSLYYLQADDMVRVVRRASELAPIMVLQANTLSKPRDRREKASVAFLKKLLQENGFPEVETFAPPGYNRPLLVGRNGE